MKKSIVAMLSITALATVANAEVSVLLEPTGTHFEGTTIGAPLYANCDDSGVYSETVGPFFWYASTNWTAETAQADTTTQFGTYTNFWVEYSGDRPEIAGRAGTTNRCLLIDTEGGRLFRRIGGTTDSGEGIANFPQYDVTSTVYFDSLVQFTVNEDEAPTIQTGDKLAVWLKGGDTTNLVITAGLLDDVGGLTETHYVISTSVASIEPGTWHRLTIESFKLASSSGAMPLGFRVFIDGTVVSSDTGSGDLSSWLAVVDETAEISSEVAGYVTAKTLFPSLVNESGDNCDTLSCVAFEGTGAVDDLTFTPNDPFAGAAPAVPTVDGKEPADGDAFIAAATSRTANILPTGWTVENNVIKDGNNETYATIPAFYTATLTDGTLTLVLNTTALPTIGAADVTVGEETEAKEAIEVDATTFTATLTGTEAKLYYGLSVATTPNPANWPAPASLTKGTGSAMQLTADKPVDGSTVAPAAFFKVYVTDIAPAAPAPAGE